MLRSRAELRRTGPADQTPGFLGSTPSLGSPRAPGRRVAAAPGRENGRGRRPERGLGGAAPALAPARPRLPGAVARALSPIAARGAQPRPAASFPAGHRLPSQRHDHPANNAPGPGALGLPPRGGQGLRAASRHFPGKRAWGARGARRSQAGERCGLEGRWGGWGSEGAVGDGGLGNRVRSRDRRAHPGAPAAPCAARSPRSSGPPPPAAQSRRCAHARAGRRPATESLKKNGAAVGPSPRKRGSECGRALLSGEGIRVPADPARWETALFASSQVAEWRLEAPGTTWNVQWSGWGVYWGASGINFKHTTETIRCLLLGPQTWPDLTSLIPFGEKAEFWKQKSPHKHSWTFPFPCERWPWPYFFLAFPDYQPIGPFPPGILESKE